MSPEQLIVLCTYTFVIFAITIATGGGGRKVRFSDAVCGRECPVGPDIQ